METPAHIFREYDVRGLVDEDLSDDLVRALGSAFATFMRRAAGSDAVTLALGWDVRPSSPRLRDALTEGMVAAGARVLDVGLVPTPVLYYAGHRLETDGGVMITGSHNPPEYNGFKLGYRDLPLSGAEIQEVREIITTEAFVSGAGTREERPVTEEYCDMVASKVNLEREVRVVLDPANACGALFAGDLLQRVGARVDRLYDDVDGTFPSHHPDPTVDAYVVDLRRRVVEIDVEVGIGLDGDCDRIGAVDETGRLIRGDQLTAIFARDQLQRTPGVRILYDVKSSRALEEDIRTHGGVPFMWKTGHSHAKRKMKEEGIPFGGEMSGHLFFFDDYWGFDDAIFAACKLCEILSRSETSLAAMVDSLNSYSSTPEVRIETTEERKWELVREAKEWFGERYDTVDIDGVRITFEKGWALLRASNTQPVVVLRAEGQSESDLTAIKLEIERFLSARGIEEIPWNA